MASREASVLINHTEYLFQDRGRSEIIVENDAAQKAPFDPVHSSTMAWHESLVHFTRSTPNVLPHYAPNSCRIMNLFTRSLRRSLH